MLRLYGSIQHGQLQVQEINCKRRECRRQSDMQIVRVEYINKLLTLSQRSCPDKSNIVDITKQSSGMLLKFRIQLFVQKICDCMDAYLMFGDSIE